MIEEPGSDLLIVGFMPPGGLYGVPANLLHALLAPGGAHALYLYDSKALYHLAGTDRFGDGYSAMIDGILGEAARLSVQRIVTVGMSATGFTALRAALDLNAAGMIGISAVTSFAEADMVADGRLPAQRQRLLHHIRDSCVDLMPALATRTCCAAITNYYDARSAEYAVHAKRLAGLSGVTLHPIAGQEATDAIGRLLLAGHAAIVANAVAHAAA